MAQLFVSSAGQIGNKSSRALSGWCRYGCCHAQPARQHGNPHLLYCAKPSEYAGKIKRKQNQKRLGSAPIQIRFVTVLLAKTNICRIFGRQNALLARKFKWWLIRRCVQVDHLPTSCWWRLVFLLNYCFITAMNEERQGGHLILTNEYFGQCSRWRF